MTMSLRSIQWPVIRVLLFLCIGCMNTVLIRPEDVNMLKHGIGFAILTLGLVEGGLLMARRLRRSRQHGGPGPGDRQRH